ncbi:MAG TPA: lytic transglycosylase domain-containing protein [Bryobacteraceae bacterium]
MAARFAWFLLGVGLALPCLGGETIYLANGFRLQAQSHLTQGDAIVIRTQTGTLEFPKKLVGRIVKESADGSAPAPPKRLSPRPHELLSKAAKGEGLEPELVESVAKIESGFEQSAVSAKGAVGLMQLMPATAAELGVTATNADSNALGGAKYLRELLLRYGGNYVLALAAYNAGPGAVAKYHGVPPYSETVHYVQKVLREYKREKVADSQ